MPTDFRTAFEHARKLHAAGRLAEAEQAYRRLTVPAQQREAVLAALCDLYLQSGRPLQAVDLLVALTQEDPGSLHYFGRLARLLEELGRNDDAISHYERLVQRLPDLPEAHFNLALLNKNARRYDAAAAAYDEALRLGIDHREEVYSNFGVLYSEMRQAEKAREMYEKALDVDGRYVPALFNLAGLCEETGERERAVELYRRILALEPGHADSLSRLAYAQRVNSAEDPLIGELRHAAEHGENDALSREGLYFALGKALDDAGSYDEAFDAYRTANELGSRRNPPYDRAAMEQAIDSIVGLFDETWLRRHETTSEASPIFICGMYRSGSTLAEQILAAHPDVRAGGELDLLPWLVARRLAPYPQSLAETSVDALERVAQEYVSGVQGLFPDAANVTDKRPDNILHLGLIRALFPKARIVCTRRERRDNCLSVYFQQLAGTLNYATDLENTAHYHAQQERLMAHWQRCFRGHIFTLDYDVLVRGAEPVLRDLLGFLGLPWHAGCLEFQNARALVKTASVWQVREALHTRSSGRWRNYEQAAAALTAGGDGA